MNSLFVLNVLLQSSRSSIWRNVILRLLFRGALWNCDLFGHDTSREKSQTFEDFGDILDRFESNNMSLRVQITAAAPRRVSESRAGPSCIGSSVRTVTIRHDSSSLRDWINHLIWELLFTVGQNHLRKVGGEMSWEGEWRRNDTDFSSGKGVALLVLCLNTIYMGV